MFENIYNYINYDLSIRQNHIDLTEECLEIGGSSQVFKGLLAHFLKTTIPNNGKIILCHFCGNGKCSNPKHLYWGTYSENLKDAYSHGARKNTFSLSIEKNGLNETLRKWKKISSIGGKVGGATRQMKESEIFKYKEAIDQSNPLEYGWVGRASKKLNISHTQIKRFVDKYYPLLERYQRK